MSCLSAAAFNLRRYGRASRVDRHDFAQWVVPVQGELAFELDGRGARLDLWQGAFVAPSAGHAQSALDADRFLIVDCPAALLDPDTLQQLYQQPVLALPLQVRTLAQRVAATPGAAIDAAVVARELPRLLQAFSLAGSATRLQAVCAHIQQVPGQAWPVERIAAQVGVSSSRVHALFRQAFGMSPLAWLSACRLRWARGQLATGDMPIADIAQYAGYSEQSALTRALRREWGLTPADYRRQHRQ
ncbi:AraC family transcriptional regulator [Bacillus subtilis subsp. subtilis]|nr:AraC family transcriptional regulator [Bacillus subtilis subsp. subtilis]